MPIFLKQLPLIVFLIVSACLGQAPDVQSYTPKISVSGSNLLQFARGYNIDKPSTKEPWNYLTNYLDFDIMVQNFFLQGRFQIDEPSLGYNPYPPVYREYFSRRSVGFKTSLLNIEAGHFNTLFGRGLTLNLQEDITIERAKILDGLLMQVPLPWIELKGIVGRGIEEKISQGFIISDYYVMNDTMWITDLTQSQSFDNLHYRDNIIGFHLESFPFSYIPLLSFMSGSSIGCGIIQYRTNVSEIEIGRKIEAINVIDSTTWQTDTTFGQEYMYYQNRGNVYLPSALMNISVGSYDMYIEHARMLYKRH
ncbi:MAG: DUF6029 family protein, partial [Elusimicrobiota bacterium]